MHIDFDKYSWDRKFYFFIGTVSALLVNMFAGPSHAALSIFLFTCLVVFYMRYSAFANFFNVVMCILIIGAIYWFLTSSQGQEFLQSLNNHLEGIKK